VIIHQTPVILTKQAIVLVNVEIGGYNGADGTTVILWLTETPDSPFQMHYGGPGKKPQDYNSRI
jgi:hypothetical protein